jgi:hypothetical protein
MQNLGRTKALIPSRVPDSRDVPMAELLAVSRVTTDAALVRAQPTSQQASPAAAGAFQSAI